MTGDMEQCFRAAGNTCGYFRLIGVNTRSEKPAKLMPALTDVISSREGPNRIVGLQTLESASYQTGLLADGNTSAKNGSRRPCQFADKPSASSFRASAAKLRADPEPSAYGQAGASTKSRQAPENINLRRAFGAKYVWFPDRRSTCVSLVRNDEAEGLSAKTGPEGPAQFFRYLVFKPISSSRGSAARSAGCRPP